MASSTGRVSFCRKGIELSDKDIPTAYQAAEVERKWYAFWLEKNSFVADVESPRPAFSIVLPPPNVTGSLHMGHALNITLQDILIRWKRMKGFNALWVPGTDHAGIATQNVVERQLAAEGLDRRDIGREKFEARVWEWKEVAEKRILGQMRRLGCACDWSRTRFTLDEGLSSAVREVFVRLYEEGLIYRGEYLVNWCPRCSTAISDLEVEYAPARGKLWHLRYPVQGGGFVVVATTRPETMLGDTAVMVHPDDDRYRLLHGKTVTLPLMNREIPLLADAFVDKEFGTGAVKVTPGHDPNDFEAGRRHGLEVVKVIGEDGRMTAAAGNYQGLDRFEARRQVVADLDALGLIDKIEEHEHNVGRCQRCDTVIEPLVSTQWFVKVGPLAEVALKAVQDRKTVFIPDNYGRVYFEWMSNIHDWCISRQLWWGHRIPAWFCDRCGGLTVARETPEQCAQCGSDQLRQESDVLDTWFSSGLWPFSTLGWPEKTADLETYYPTSTLVTGFDIIFFWVARMMMMGLHFMGDVPFRQVHINGLVRDEQGRKMSKSLGNVVDPLDIIENYGADSIRFTLSSMAVPGTDIPFSVSRMAGYRAFCNKIWNAGRFLLLNLDRDTPVAADRIEELRKAGELGLEDVWILGRLQQVIAATDDNLEKFRFHEASNDLYHFFWNDLCSWYIELIKNRIASDDRRRRESAATVGLFLLETSLRLLHPFIPFVTEELWQRLPHEGEVLLDAAFPAARQDWIEEGAMADMAQLQELISAIRTTRTENRVAPRDKVPARLVCREGSRPFLESQKHHLENLASIEPIEFVSALGTVGQSIQGVSSLAEFSLLLEDVVDLEAEKDRLRKQIESLEADAARQQSQLANEAFVSKAPEHVVEGVRQRLRETLDRLEKTKKQLHGLS